MPKLNISAMSKGDIRKHRALCRSVGDEIGTNAMIAWLGRRPNSGASDAPDKAAIAIADALEPLRNNGVVKMPLHGYTVKRTRRIGGVEPKMGFSVVRNTARAK